MNTPKLRGAETASPTFTTLAWEGLIDEIIRDMRGKQPQQFRRADGRQLHKPDATQ